jgi:hypothetical protein
MLAWLAAALATGLWRRSALWGRDWALHWPAPQVGAAVGVSVSVGWGEVPVLRVAVEGAGDIGRFDALLRAANVEYDGRRSSGRGRGESAGGGR